MRYATLKYLILVVPIIALSAFPALAQSHFIRGDVNCDGQVTDPEDIDLITFHIMFHTSINCSAAADVNGDGNVNLSDVNYLVAFLRTGGAPPPAPFPNCGVDPGGATCEQVCFCDGSTSCCGLYTGGMTGNVDCSPDGKRNLADITRMIDFVYVSKEPLCCLEDGNVEGDAEGKVNLADITRLIDHVYVSKGETVPCL